MEDLLFVSLGCQDFLRESNGIPLIKNLPSTYGDFKKVKARYKSSNDVGNIINEAFDCCIFERAVFCNGPISFNPILDERVSNFDIYYVFPPDGYQYLHNPTIANLTEVELPTTLDQSSLIELFKLGYSNQNLQEALLSEGQVIIYNIPHFYCVKASIVEYDDLYQQLTRT